MTRLDGMLETGFQNRGMHGGNAQQVPGQGIAEPGNGVAEDEHFPRFQIRQVGPEPGEQVVHVPLNHQLQKTWPLGAAHQCSHQFQILGVQLFWAGITLVPAGIPSGKKDFQHGELGMQVLADLLGSQIIFIFHDSYFCGLSRKNSRHKKSDRRKAVTFSIEDVVP